MRFKYIFGLVLAAIMLSAVIKFASYVREVHNTAITYAEKYQSARTLTQQLKEKLEKQGWFVKSIQAVNDSLSQVVQELNSKLATETRLAARWRNLAKTKTAVRETVYVKEGNVLVTRFSFSDTLCGMRIKGFVEAPPVKHEISVEQDPLQIGVAVAKTSAGWVGRVTEVTPPCWDVSVTKLNVYEPTEKHRTPIAAFVGAFGSRGFGLGVNGGLRVGQYYIGLSATPTGTGFYVGREWTLRR